MKTGDKVMIRGLGKPGCVIGTIRDGLTGDKVYKVAYYDDGLNTNVLCTEDVLTEICDRHYEIRTDVADNVVITILNEVDDDGKVVREIARNHGHIIHDGALGFIQAVSFGAKRMYERMTGNNA